MTVRRAFQNAKRNEKADVQFRPIRTFVTCSVGVDWLIIDKMANEKIRQDKKFPFFYKIKGLDPRGFD